jgi:hypothetical protein
MIRKTLVQSLAVFAAVALFAGSAQAAFFSLTPQGSDTIAVAGTVTFDANWTQEGGDANGAGLDFNIVVSNSAVAGITSADTTGNPFQLPALNLTFGAGAPDEMLIGGADIFGPGQVGTVFLGTVTLTGNSAGSTDILSGAQTQWVDPGFVVGQDNTATILATVTVGTVPEPTALVLMGLGVAGVAFLRRRSA